MDAREILSDNLKTLMAHKGWTGFEPITKASEGLLSNGTLDRIRRKATNPRLGLIELLAQVFGLEPWQVLYANLDPAHPPHIPRMCAMAFDTARIIDAIDDEATKRKVYAFIVQAVELGNTQPSTKPELSAEPTPSPVPHR